MKKFIEFKLHAGRVPYFVRNTFHVQPIVGKLYGISKDTTSCYLPDTVVTFEEQAFKDKLFADATITKTIDEETVVLAGQEKQDYINAWVEKCLSS